MEIFNIYSFLIQFSQVVTIDMSLFQLGFGLDILKLAPEFLQHNLKEMVEEVKHRIVPLIDDMFLDQVMRDSIKKRKVLMLSAKVIIFPQPP